MFDVKYFATVAFVFKSSFYGSCEGLKGVSAGFSAHARRRMEPVYCVVSPRPPTRHRVHIIAEYTKTHTKPQSCTKKKKKHEARNLEGGGVRPHLAGKIFTVNECE